MTNSYFVCGFLASMALKAFMGFPRPENIIVRCNGLATAKMQSMLENNIQTEQNYHAG